MFLQQSRVIQAQQRTAIWSLQPQYVLSRSSHVWVFHTHGLQSTRLFCPWDPPGKNIGVDCHVLLQGILWTQGSNPSLLCVLHWQEGSLPLAPPGEAWNHSEPCTSPVGREGECFLREEKQLGGLQQTESLAFYWLSCCQERS